MRLARAQLIKWIRIAWLFDQDAINLALQLQPSRLYLLPGHFNCFRGWCFDQQLQRQAIHHQRSSQHFKVIRSEYMKQCAE
jgi:hypothetical protein